MRPGGEGTGLRVERLRVWIWFDQQPSTSSLQVHTGIAAAVQKVSMVMGKIRKLENINAWFLLHAGCSGSAVRGGGAGLCYCSSVGRFMPLWFGTEHLYFLCSLLLPSLLTLLLHYYCTAANDKKLHLLVVVASWSSSPSSVGVYILVKIHKSVTKKSVLEKYCNTAFYISLFFGEWPLLFLNWWNSIYRWGKKSDV